MANAFVHLELMAADVEKAKKFYSDLFSWELEDTEMGPLKYTTIKPGEGPGGGMLKNPMPGPSQWLAYVNVPDVRAATKKATALGAKVHKEYTEVPGMGAFTIIQDPGGAWLGLWEPKMRG